MHTAATAPPAARYPPDTIRLGSTTDNSSSSMSAPASAAAAAAVSPSPRSAFRFITAALLRVTAMTPERALRLESTVLTVIGVFHILAPLFMLRASFMSAVVSAASSACPSGIEQLAAGGDDGLAIIGVLVSTLQAIGGLYVLTASILCTAAAVATKEMLRSLATGHLANAVLYLVIPLNFSLPPGSLSFSFFALLLHLKLAVWLYAIARRQPQRVGRLSAHNLWLDLAQDGEQDDVDGDDDDDEHSDGSPLINKAEAALMDLEWSMDRVAEEEEEEDEEEGEEENAPGAAVRPRRGAGGRITSRKM